MKRIRLALLLSTTALLCSPAIAETETRMTITSSGNVSGTNTTPPVQVLSAMPSGVVKISTTTGGTLTITMPPATGAVIANAAAHPSPETGRAAGQSCAKMLTASGLPGGVVTSVANAVQQTCGGGTVSAATTAMTQAVSSIRTALASGAVSPDMAKGLVAWLSALRAAR